MNELVERVARALLRADHEHADGPTQHWDDAEPLERIYFLAGAEAAIAAVRAWDVEQQARIHRRVGPGKCSCGFDAYQQAHYVYDYGDELRWHINKAKAAAVERARGEGVG
jgi:hypothetical protein